MKKLLIITISIIFSLEIVDAQKKITWPEITKESKPWARWWWMGSAVNDSELTYNMELYQKAGLGGLEITPIYGVKGYESQFINFLSPKWIEVFTHTLKEGKRLGLGIDLANATGWPFGGPWVMPEDAAKYIAYSTYKLNGGESLPDTIKYMQKQIIRVTSRKVDPSEISDPIANTPNLQEKALDQVRLIKPLPLFTVMAYSDKGESIDLTSKVNTSGKLEWTAPAGNWTIYALFMGKHGKIVERAAPGGEGDVIDHFSEVALKRYLNEFDGAFNKKDISGLRGFFNDSYEVDDANGEANWTLLMFDEFRKRRGYDLQSHLPELFSKVPSDASNRVLCDYRETISDMIYEHFTTLWHEWAKKQGKIVRNQAHGSPANILDLYSTVDIPEIEGTNFLRLKFASSAANIMSKKYASSEAATWLNDHFMTNLGDVKTALDRFLLAGINHNFYHGVNYSPKNDPWPGWLFYAAVHFQPVNPFWTDFAKLNHYVTRCQSFLQKGTPDNDVLLYFPIHESWSTPSKSLLRHYDGFERNFENIPIEKDAEYLQEKGYAFDYISDRMLKNLRVSGNTLKAPGGTYQTLIFAQPKLIPEQTLIKIIQLAESGATIIFYKTLPEDIPGLHNLSSRRAMLKNLLGSIHFEKADSMSVANYGKGKILLGNDLGLLLEKANIRREKMYDAGLQCIRRKTETGTTYFIANWSDSIKNGWIPLQTKAKTVALFNPMKNSYGTAKMRNNNNGTIDVYVQLQKGESCVLQTSPEIFKDDFYPYYKEHDNAITITGKWKLTFTNGGPELASPKTIENLVSWTKMAGDTGKIFSGTASYKITFPKPNIKGKAYILDLGKVHESARIILNGTPTDTLLGPIYQTIIPNSAFEKINTLEIQVSNLMANRIEYMDKQNIVWRKFYNINFSAKKAENRDANGLFTTVNWQPMESGLLGPVKLIPVDELKIK